MPEFPAFKLPALEYLDVSNNKLESVQKDWNGHANLKVLKCADNKFKNLKPFCNMPKLEELYLGGNLIAEFTELSEMGALKKLHLRKNKIGKIGFEKNDEEEAEGLPELPALEYLNLRGNKLRKMK